MLDTIDQPPKQFGLKPMFCATALVAAWAWSVRIESFLALFISYLLSCSAIAFTGIAKTTDPVLRGILAGALIPPILWNAALFLAHDGFTAASLLDTVLFGCLALPFFGAFFGAFAGALVAAAGASAAASCPAE